MVRGRRSPALVVPLPVALLVVALLVALLLYENGSAALRHVRKPRAPFWFVHLPKAGGTAVENCILRSCPDMAGEGTGHAVTESAAVADGRKPVLIFREPLARLRSAFSFFQRSRKVKRADIGPLWTRSAVLEPL